MSGPTDPLPPLADACPPLVDVPTGAGDADVECSNCCTPMDEPHTWRQCAEGLWKKFSAKCDDECDARTKLMELEDELARLKGTRMFPIQLERNADPHPMQIPWSVAELAYSVYAARYGRGQSLERLAERGGFAPSEMDKFLPDWRARCEEIGTLREENAQLRTERDRFATDRAEVCKALGERAHPGMSPGENVAAVVDQNARLRAACASMLALISESRGVAGLHLNGDEASWDSLLCGPFSEWLEKLEEVRGIVEDPAR